MKVLNIVVIVLACINIACTILNLIAAKRYHDARDRYEAALKELEEEEPDTRFIINDDDLPTETCTSDWIVGNFDA